MRSENDNASEEAQEIQNIIREIQILTAESQAKKRGFFSKNAEVISGIVVLIVVVVTLYFSIWQS